MVLNNRTDTEGNQPPGKKAMDNKEGTKEGSKMTYTCHLLQILHQKPMKVFTTVKETVPKNHRELLIKIGSSLHQSLDFPQHSIENEKPHYFCVPSFKANPGGVACT